MHINNTRTGAPPFTFLAVSPFLIVFALYILLSSCTNTNTASWRLPQCLIRHNANKWVVLTHELAIHNALCVLDDDEMSCARFLALQHPMALMCVAGCFISITLCRGSRGEHRGLPLVALLMASTACTAVEYNLSEPQIAVCRVATCFAQYGQAVCWGRSDRGQLGRGDTEDIGDDAGDLDLTLNAIDLGPNFIVKQLEGSCGKHNCAVSVDGRLKCFGLNSYGQLGLGDIDNRGDGPNQMGLSLPDVDLGEGFVVDSVSLGHIHTCALSTNHTAKCFGGGENGRLGIGDATESSRGDEALEMADYLPLLVFPNAFVPVQLSAGFATSCAASADGRVCCFGAGSSGLMGQGNEDDAYTPTIVRLGQEFAVAFVSVGCWSGCAVSADGAMKCWGLNGNGQLGYSHNNNIGDDPNEMSSNLLIVNLGSSFVVKQVTAGFYHRCVLSTDNRVKCFGKGTYGMLGSGSEDDIGSDMTGDDVPTVDFGVGFNVTALATGGGELYHRCAVSATAAMRCWGGNGFGRLGMGDTDNRFSPVTPQLQISITTAPTSAPSDSPTANPTEQTLNPTPNPTWHPSTYPTTHPSNHPTALPTRNPTVLPTADPTRMPSQMPSSIPTRSPTNNPSAEPTTEPTTNPTLVPTIPPSAEPTKDPTQTPTNIPSAEPTTNPTWVPTTPPSAEPTTNPSPHPSAQPTVNPTALPTGAPSLAPTAAPTISPTAKPTPHWSNQLSTTDWIAFSSSALALILCALGCVAYFWCLAQKERDSAMKVKKAMVVVAAIGEYDKRPANPCAQLKSVGLTNLDVTKDIKGLHSLFGPKQLNYDVFPKGDELFKTRWSESELVQMLEACAKDMNERITRGEHFDGLVVVITGHGTKHNICTSDYQLIEKVVIHRIFSAQYPKLREFPRLFLYDCCAGNDQQLTYRKDLDESSPDADSPKSVDSEKTYTVNDVQRPHEIWIKGEKNPDHKLIEIHAANEGFQAKINSDIGSYLISSFVKKMRRNQGTNAKYICEVMDEIQKDLAMRGKQQIVPTYNDQTRYVVFERNDEQMQRVEQHQQIELAMGQMERGSSLMVLDDGEVQAVEEEQEAAEADLVLVNDDV